MLTIRDFVTTFENPEGLFKSLTQINVCTDNYNHTILCSGGNACIFMVENKGELVMVKCYITKLAFLCEKYSYLSTINSKYLPKYQYLKDEIFVYSSLKEQGEWHNVLTASWVQGETLDNVISWAVKSGDKQKIEALSKEFDDLAIYLLDQPWAHGDIKPQNIIVDDSGAMTLIDFDSMYYPDSPIEANTGLGTTTFQHPLRNENIFDRHIDDYSLLIISVSLHALCCDINLYKRFHFDDNIILSSTEIFDEKSLSYNFLCEIWAKNTIFTLMLNMLKSKKLQLPKLKEILIKLNC